MSDWINYQFAKLCFLGSIPSQASIFLYLLNMEIKKCQNDWILETTKIYKKRKIALSSIPYPIRNDGKKGCIWCCDKLKDHHSARYCNDPMCKVWAQIWADPQCDISVHFLLKKQNYLCGMCHYDYSIKLKEISKNYDTKFSKRFIAMLKNRLPYDLSPEVDHIIPILTGGISLGVGNHQVLCYSCHKIKTKEDIKLPKRLKSPEEIEEIRKIKIQKQITKKLQQFLKIHGHKGSFEINNRIYKTIFLNEYLNLEEIQLQYEIYKKHNLFDNDLTENEFLLIIKSKQTK